MLKLINLLVFSVFLTFELFSQAHNIDSLRRVILEVEDTARVNVLIKSANNYSKSDLDLADSLARKALDLLEMLEYPEGLINCWNSLSFIRSSKGNIEEGYDFCAKSHTIK